MGAGPSTQSNVNANGENTPGSTKRPFPWASSESQERDKRPRGGSGNATTSSASEDPEETMSTDESAYASAAESPNPNFSRSPTRADWPLSTVDESETRTLATAPRIPTPAALRSSSPLQLPNLSLSIQSGFRPVSPPTTTSVNTPLRLALPPRSIPPNNVTSSEPRTQPLDLGWLTQQLDEALPPPRDRAFSLSFGSASVDSALPHPQHSRAGSTRVPLPWVDIEGESIGSSLLAASELASTSVSASLEIESESGSLGADSVAESVTSSPGAASTVRSDHSPPTIAPVTHSPLTATATRRPLSLNLRNFPLVPGPDSPSTAFPTSASPRTSAFDLAVTPPGSALPSFVARMMEVDSPVHGGGDSYISSQAGTFASSTDQAGSYAPPRSRTGTFTSSIPQTTYVPPPPPPQAESYPSSPHLDGGDASLDALRRFMRQESTTEPTHQAVNLVEHQNTGLLRQSEGESASSVSPNQAPTAVAVGSYFPPVRTDERQPHTGVPRGVQPYRGGYEQHPAQQTTRNTHPEQLSRISQEHFSGHTQLEEVARNGSIEQPSRTTHPSEDSNLDSIYSRRLTESGASFPSRPSDSGASLPSFRATVSPEPGRMSWSDFFGPRTPETGGSDVAISAGGSEITMGTRGSEISAGTRTSEVTTGMRSSEATMGTVSTRGAETGMNTRGTADIGTSTSRAGVRSALTRVVRLPGSEGPPRLHFDALPREDRSSATNLSRTPPGPDSHPAVWFEDDSTRPRRTSSTRWTDLFPEPASAPVPIIPRPTNRTRMPPPVSVSSTDSTVFDPLTGMSWNRNSQAVPEPSPAYDATSSLARYQTFAQSIDEIRRSPPPPQQGVSPEPNWGESGNNRTSWAFPRHEPPQYEVPPPTNGNWLREWESQRDRRSRAARDDYLRRQGSDYPSNDRRYHTEYANSDEVPRRPPMAQLSDTQAQGQLWPEFVAHSRPLTRPMTRASLVATGFADSDLWPENDESNTRLWGEIPRPARRQEILPAPVGDVAAPVQFLPSNHEAGVVFTESPPSLLGGFDDPNYSELIPGDAQPSRPDPINFRSASHVLRASLVDTSRRASDGPTRPLVAAEPERTRVSSRERWESHLTRSQVQLERVRQLLHSE
ncbi:unnamed protein product [Rhizoctonia solani]|uniref:Uncharacterized protein n=1 Tax=Rhizoctonia solani TaxID=456999 RepID=A0A8H2Y591_9AGAM|nr:unnamed protein product [Rhizoctonia solani]